MLNRVKNISSISVGIFSLSLIILIAISFVVNCSNEDAYDMVTNDITLSKYNNESHEEVNGSEPLFSTNLSNSVKVDVYDAIVYNDYIVLDYAFQTPESTYINRRVTLNNDLSELNLYDNNGLITGYKLHEENDLRTKLSLLAYDDSFNITADLTSEENITIGITTDGYNHEFNFNNYDELDLCFDIYSKVYNNQINRDSLTNDEKDLLSQAEQISFLMQSFSLNIYDNDISSAYFLAVNKDLQTWINDNYETDPLYINIPEIICKIVKIAKKVCSITGGNSKTCEWVEVFEEVCALLKELDIIK